MLAGILFITDAQQVTEQTGDVLSQEPTIMDSVTMNQNPVELDCNKGSSDSIIIDTTGNQLLLNESELTFDESSLGEVKDKKGSFASFFRSYIVEPARVTLKHAVSYKVEKPNRVRNNRSSVRLEYSKFFLNNFFLQFDSRINAYWMNDHRLRKSDDVVQFKSGLREAYLQVSFGKTSLKTGYQILIWGESDGGVITDVISPRDYSELFFISLEESRIGQPMFTLDQYTSIGDWCVFFIPFPAYNEYPEVGTKYYYDAFNGNVEYQYETRDKNSVEYGMRWKKTFGKSDICLMTASLMNNEYTYEMKSSDLVTKNKMRYYLVGMTSNYAWGSLLFKGEIGIKSHRAYNNSVLQIVKKNSVDASVGFDYSPGRNFVVNFETVNNRILKWSKNIQSAPKNLYSVILVLNDKFINDNLNVSLMTTYSEPYTSVLSILTTSYKWNDHLILELDGYYPYTNNSKSNYWLFKDEKQIAFKIQYQF